MMTGRRFITSSSSSRMKNVVFLAWLLLYGAGMYWLGMRSGQKEAADPATAAVRGQER